MTSKGLLVFVALAALICAFSGFVSVNAAQRSGDLEGEIRSLDLSKSVPALLNYQGYLATTDSGAVDETLAMTFRLFDSATKGTELWAETHPAVEVSNGQFYILLGSVTSFPAGLFDGSILYLQMEVGSEVFTPRKAIVSVAYSQMTDQAVKADSAAYAAYATDAHHAVHADTAAYSPGTNPWSVSGDDAYRLTGKVGIGTASPAAELEVIGTIDADAYTINGTALGTSDDSYWSETGSDIYYMPGNVGVGTNTPTARLHVVDSKGHTGSLGGTDYGAFGQHSGGNEGHLGSEGHGAYGKYDGNDNEGVLGGLNAGVEGYGGGIVGTCGVYGEDQASGNKGNIGCRFEGVYGYNATSGNEGFLGGEGSDDYGVGGAAASGTGKGVYGSNTSSGNFGWLGGSGEGVYGENGSGHFGNLGGSGEGAYGQSSGGDYCRLGAPGKGVEAVNSNGNLADLATTSYGVYGEHNNGNGGVIGSSEYGVYGLHNGGNLGYLADSDLGAYGEHSSGNWGSLGGSDTGVYGEHDNGNYGTLGYSDHGAFGYNNSNGNFGFFGGSSLDYGAYGQHGSSGNFGSLGGSNEGVYAQHSSNNLGYLANSNHGAYGQHSSGNLGYLGSNDAGVYGKHSSGNYGLMGTIGSGIHGQHSNGNYGHFGTELYGIYGRHYNGNYGWIGGADVAVHGNNVVSGTSVSLAGPSHSGWFIGDVVVQGNLNVQGNLSKSSGEFKIDHPLDPENKYLHHSFVESPDMMNIYNGNAVLDDHGRAWVELPEWFDALNRDFRYQLTCVGGFAPVYIAEKISGNRFKIAGGDPGMEISWQVTGIRQDPYSDLHRIPVEEQKSPEERGYYLHPEAYGQSEEKNVNYAAVPR